MAALAGQTVAPPAPVTPLHDHATAERPPIAHLTYGANIGLCGAVIQGIPAPADADRCLVCADLGGVEL